MEVTSSFGYAVARPEACSCSVNPSILALFSSFCLPKLVLYGNLGDYDPMLRLIYFGCVTLIPATVAGMSFSLFVNLLYDLGEQHIALVYAISTMGNVLSGLIHGIILVPYVGMFATYLVALGSTGIAMLLVVRWRFFPVTVLLIVVGGATIAAGTFEPMPTRIRNRLLWSKDDIYGLVQVVDSSDRWEGWQGGKGIDVLIHHRHNCSNEERGINWHKNSAVYAMELLNNSGKNVLLLGYCSGSTVLKFLEYRDIVNVISIEMNKKIVEAAKIFFPSIYEKLSNDKRSVIVIDEFRNYLRRQPATRKFDIVMVDITIDDPYYASMFTKEFFTDIYEHLQQPGVLFFNSYQEFLRTGAEVFEHLLCVKEHAYEQAFFFFTNFALPQEQSTRFYEAFPRQQSGRIYTNNKVYQVSPATSPPKERCLS